MRLHRSLCAVVLLAWVGAADAGDTYYMAVFASQLPDVNRPKYTHSFGVFVRACTGPDGACRLESLTISWLPETGEVRTLRPLPEPGKNFDLHSTLRLVIHQGERVSMWGPYQIDGELFCRAVKHKAHLESGEVRYKAIDTGYPTRRVSNCIHALSDLSEESPRLRIASPGWGDPASYFITMTMRPWIVDRDATHDWIADALGLRDYPITRRRLEEGNPAEGPIVRALQVVTQRRLRD